jgi:aryl-alcohol dehydrogenase
MFLLKEKLPPSANVFVLPLNFAGARLDGTTTLREGDEVIHGSFFGQSSFANSALAN